MKKAFLITVSCVLCIITAISIYYFSSKPSLEKIKDSVVKIEVYDDSNELIATGSGFCAFESDYIITNYHVVKGANSIKVITDDNSSHSTSNILIFDVENDIAILSANVELTPLEFGNTDNLKAGQKVTAIGSPLGELNTVSEGIISNAENKKGIQISAAISHGSSGGALFNNRNKLIGITYATLESGQNLNYAISLDYLNKLYKAYVDKTYFTINENNYEDSMRSDNIVEFDGFSYQTKKYYSVSSFNTFYKTTNPQERLEYWMSNSLWSDVYSTISNQDKNLIVDKYIELTTIELETESNISNSIENWTVTDFMLNLDVLEKQELAVSIVDIKNFNSDDARFDRVEEYPLSAAQKSLILYLIADRRWTDIHVDNKEDIFDFFDEKGYETKELGVILESLGYDVVYEDDGNLTAYW